MFGDLTKRVLMVYKADTASAQADIKKLSLTQKEHASALKKDLDAQNVGLEAQIGKYAKYAAQAAAAYGAIKVGLDSMEFFYERQELREKAQGHSIDDLKTATRGLRSETELLKLAQAANNGVMKASSGELVVLAQAMDVFEDRGHEATKVMADFHEFLQTGKAKALKDYGLQIDEARGSAAQFTQVMQQLGVVSKQQAAIETDARDKWDQSKIAMADTIAQLRESGGALVAEWQPALIGIADLLRKSAEGWGSIFQGIKDGIASLPEWYTHAKATEELNEKIKGQQIEIRRQHELMNETMAERARLDAELLDMERRIALSFVSMMTPEWQQRMMGVGKFMGTGIAAGMQSGMSKFLGALGITSGVVHLDEKEMAAIAAEGEKAAAALKGGKGGGGPKVTIDIEIPDVSAMRAKYAKMTEEWERVQAEARSQSVADFQEFGFKADIGALPEAMQTASELQANYQQFNAGRTQSVFREMFGDPEEINLYASGFSMLKDASVAAFQAVMTGSMSAGAAFKKMMASQMMTLASTMFGRSIYEAAAALGSLAGMDYRGAAAHGAAAAKYAAGAILLGSIAASMGGGGSAATGGAGGNASVGPSTRSAAVAQGDGAGSGRNISIIVGDDFADDSPRKRQQKAERLVKMGLRSSREVVFA